ncbi:hypothetical protein JAAARDRAFT_154768 [Jaapia argillacea MUCL 33604]|uniref:Ribophorin II n=1 Tax=Jaapia argillacea MUCL 33604 TaxID=933084 RepID=A0A067Q6W3_9AGAM|nr:hypothetical protein JAAARDRAFT_154768 [Jaapia argillacea MUCL 33604]
MTWLLKSLPLLVLAAAVQASVLTLQSPRYTITSPTATHPRSEPVSLVEKPATPVVLGPADTLKLSFQVVEKDDGKGVQPHQTFLRFYDESTGEEGIQPIRVTSGGKAKFELNMARPPASLPPTSPTSPPLKVSLLLGSFAHSPAKFDLFELSIPASQPVAQHPDEASFHLLPEIQHTFRPEQKLPPRPVSAFFAALVLTPWVVLIGLCATIQPTVPHLFSPRILPFTTLLGAFEALLLWYWVDLKIGQVLMYGGVLAVLTATAGKQALGTTGAWRTGSK